MEAINDLPVEYLRSILEYDEINGGLIWKYRFDRSSSWNAQFAGKRVGSLHKSGYVHFELNGRHYLVQRVVWAIVKGEWPIGEIDHKDTIKTHNKIGNFRDATKSQNIANQGLMKNNTSNCKGVHWSKYNKKWEARIQLDGRRKFIGGFTCIAAASLAYQLEALKAHSEFARVA